MKNCRERWYEETAKVAVTCVDVTEAAQALARGHLCGPTSAYYLTRALAAVALLGSEMSEADESVSLQMKCRGPLGGFYVECTAEGTLRGYTEKKLLDEFDGLGIPDVRKVIGERQLQVTRSVPGRILSQGLATTLEGYFTQSLQRNAVIRLEAAVSDEVEILTARGVMLEFLPDSPLEQPLRPFAGVASLSIASRSLLKKLNLERAVCRGREPLRFACRCSPERSAAILAALNAQERASLPAQVEVTCHLCGRTFLVPTSV